MFKTYYVFTMIYPTNEILWSTTPLLINLVTIIFYVKRTDPFPVSSHNHCKNQIVYTNSVDSNL